MSSALVVDDNFHNRMIFKIALETAEYSVVEVESGADGLAQLNKTNFDLLVLDLQMPGMSGQEVLNAMPKNPKLHILVVTANPHMTTGPIEEVADYIMYKPINVGEFSAFVKRLKTPSQPLKQ